MLGTLRRILVYFLLSVLPILNVLHAQPTLQWAKGMGAAGQDVGYAIAVDAAGNSYVSGWFTGTVDFDPGAGVQNLASNGQSDVFILKLDASGNFQWAKRVGGTTTDLSYGLTFDPNGFVYVVGGFNGTVDFDPGAGVSNITSSAQDVFILKLDVSGNFVWAKACGGTGSEYAVSVALDGSGNVFTTGTFTGSVDFDPGAGTYNLTGTQDCFILKLDATGTFVWAKNVGGAGFDRGYSIQVDGTGNAYVTGLFNNTADFDPGAGTFNIITNGSYDVFVMKLDQAGSFQWAKGFGGTNWDQGLSLALDATGNVLVAGYFESTVDLDPGAGVQNVTTAGLADAFLLKLTNNGTFVWAKAFGGTGIDYCLSVVLDVSGNIYTTGLFANIVDFDPGAGNSSLTSAGGEDIYFQKFDPSGNLINATRIGGTGDDRGQAIKVVGNNYIYGTGYFSATCDFDPGGGTTNLVGAGQQDAFVIKLAQCTSTSSTISPTACNSYTAPGGQVFTTSGTYTATIPNVVGCDSVITINLTIITTPAQPGSISGPTTICAGTSNNYSIAFVPGATSYTWTLPSGWTGTSTTNSISVTPNTSSGTISVIATNTCGNSVAQTLFVSVMQVPASPSTLSVPSVICINSNILLAVNQVVGASSYTWTLPPGWTGTSATESINVFVGSNGGMLTVTANNMCGASTPPLTATIFVTPVASQPGPISGPSTVCVGTTNTYSINPVVGAVSYTWTLPSGWSGTSTTTSISTVAGTVGGIITVVANSPCGNSTAQTLAVTVSAIPVQPSLISGSDTVCANSTNTYSVASVSGATNYTWTLPNGWTGTSSTQTINSIASGNSGVITVSAANACGNSALQTLLVTVNSAPAQPVAIVGPTAICEGSTNTYSIAGVVGSTNYIWTLPNGWSGNSNTDSILATSNGSSGTIAVIAENSCGNSIPQTLSVATTPIPIASFSATTNLLVATFTDQSTGATSWSWDFGDGNTSSIQNPIHTFSNAGTYNVCLVATTNGCADTTCQLLTVVQVGVADGLGLDVAVFPNPNNGVTLVTCNGTCEGYLIDCSGKVVKSSTLNLGINRLDLSDLSDGIYFLSVRSRDSRKTLRIEKITE